MVGVSKALDPSGKRALFEAPVSADRRALLAPGRGPEGKAALFSAGPARPGTALVECGACGERTRGSLLDLAGRLARISAWLPARRHPHWMACPACQRRAWCRIGWNE